ncbi:MAG TPA: sugar porter family MFS transporter [Verrucomicrobiota bacterium]|nr:sugar porter family MFS transporter [Verrucomicrobiota bacterium]
MEINRLKQGNAFYVTFICIIAALGGLLFGYDTAVIADAIGFLTQKFGLSPAMKGWAASCILIGCMAGVIIAGNFSDKLGRKRTLILAGILFFISSTGSALSQTFWVFALFRIIAGIAVGVASLASPIYIAEVAPARIRGRMVSVNQLAIVGGMLLTYFVNYFIAEGEPEQWNVETGWRWMFGIGVFPSVILLTLLLKAPESPRWLTKKGKEQEAYQILEKIDGTDYARIELDSIKSAIAIEEDSIKTLLKPGLFRVLVIAVLLAILQQVTGINVFLYFAPEIFKQLGSHTDTAMLQTIVVGFVNVIFTIVAIGTVDKIGRKPLMIIGAAGMGICLLAMGLSAQLQRQPVWMLVFILGYIACFALSVGPVTWVILSEIFPTSIRGRAIGIATVFLWGADFLVTQTYPIIDSNQWLIDKFHHAFPFYLYSIMCIVLILVMVYLVPETKGKTLEEIETMWLKRK